MKVLVLGATGHIGTYLVPRLVESGHDVVAISRGERQPYQPNPLWGDVERLTVDREAEELAGTFGQRVASIGADAVIDLICFTVASARHLADALAPAGTYLLHCGTIWAHGPAVEVPVTEDAPRRPFGEYGTQKAAIEELLLQASRSGHLPCSVLHPGHIVGPGWAPINPAGNANTAVFERLARADELRLANFGLETLHHVHAADVAQAFELALAQPQRAAGEAFHVVSERALTLRGYAEQVAAWFGQPARLKFLPFEEWAKHETAADAAVTWDHIARSPSMSIAKASQLLGYKPAYTSLEAIHEALSWLIANGRVNTGGARLAPLPS
jgi:nucleoside-diphosphate-sugar epimerase